MELVSRLVGWSLSRSAGRSAGWLDGWLFSKLASYLFVSLFKNTVISFFNFKPHSSFFFDDKISACSIKIEETDYFITLIITD
jgi:hypothetical protein